MDSISAIDLLIERIINRDYSSSTSHAHGDGVGQYRVDTLTYNHENHTLKFEYKVYDEVRSQGEIDISSSKFKNLSDQDKFNYLVGELEKLLALRDPKEDLGVRRKFKAIDIEDKEDH